MKIMKDKEIALVKEILKKLTNKIILHLLDHMKLKDINFKYILRGVIVFLIFWYSVLLQYIPVIVFKLNIKKLIINN